MQVKLSESFKQQTNAKLAASLLRQCVHCGICNATCPTYQLSGDELDGPRGRIYQMKQFFEGSQANPDMLLHLDRCLGCRSCETTCPSGVEYHRLFGIGHELIEQALPRNRFERLKRWGLTRFLGSNRLLRLALACGRTLSPLLPARLARMIPRQQQPPATASRQTGRRQILMLSGCVQSALTPNTNKTARTLLNQFAIDCIEIESPHCCGAVGLHTSERAYGQQQARKLIDLWWPYVESGIEAIVTSATGCGLTIKDYPDLFAQDTAYLEKAQRISALTRDLSEVVQPELANQPMRARQPKRVAVHRPCTMQHGLKLDGLVERILTAVGHQICTVSEQHLCCGSAGTYSLLQADISAQLRHQKQRALSVDAPGVIATANIGCQLQIDNGCNLPVVHWVELLDVVS